MHALQTCQWQQQLAAFRDGLHPDKQWQVQRYCDAILRDPWCNLDAAIAYVSDYERQWSAIRRPTATERLEYPYLLELLALLKSCK